MLSEISQRKTNPYDFTYMWNQKNEINEQQQNIRNRLIDTENCQMEEGLGEWVKK